MPGTLNVASVNLAKIQNIDGTKTINLASSNFIQGKIVVDATTTGFATTSTSFQTGPTFGTQTGFTAGSILELFYHIPYRDDSGTWGGAYTEPNVSFDGGSSYFSLGTSGYDGGVMFLSTDSIHYYSNTLLINPNQTVDYSVTFRIRYSKYSGGDSLQINDSHAINDDRSGGLNTNLLDIDNSHLQHYCHYILKEYIPTNA